MTTKKPDYLSLYDAINQLELGMGAVTQIVSSSPISSTYYPRSINLVDLETLIETESRPLVKETLTCAKKAIVEVVDQEEAFYGKGISNPDIRNYPVIEMPKRLILHKARTGNRPLAAAIDGRQSLEDSFYQIDLARRGIKGLFGNSKEEEIKDFEELIGSEHAYWLKQSSMFPLRGFLHGTALLGALAGPIAAGYKLGDLRGAAVGAACGALILVPAIQNGSRNEIKYSVREAKERVRDLDTSIQLYFHGPSKAK